MKISELAQSMPYMLEMRPDIIPDVWNEIVLNNVIKLCEIAHVQERTYNIHLQDCVTSYLLDECKERIIKIDSVCYKNNRDGRTSCCGGELKIVAHNWCNIPSCGRSQFRFVLPDRVEVSQAQGLSGILTITATTAPTYDACDIDDITANNYRNAIMEMSIADAVALPGEGYSSTVAEYRRKAAKEALSRVAIRHKTGYHNRAPRLMARKFI